MIHHTTVTTRHNEVLVRFSCAASAAAALCRGQPNTYGGERPLVWGLAEQVQSTRPTPASPAGSAVPRADYLAGDVERGAEPN